jgi:hypothetical protein
MLRALCVRINSSDSSSGCARTSSGASEFSGAWLPAALRAALFFFESDLAGNSECQAAASSP